jgi:serine/threonine-protein kinase HipA
MKTLVVHYKDTLAGQLMREEDGTFRFQYEADYLASDLPEISISLPKRTNEFVSNQLFAFFDGIIPEGWLLKIATDKLRLNPLLDRFELLENLCHDTIGAVSIGAAPKSDIEQQSTDPAKISGIVRCMICYESLKDSEYIYHSACMKRVFQKIISPVVVLDQELLELLANEQINKKLAVTGVQQKLSLGLSVKGKLARLTMTDMWGNFIFKPEGLEPHLPVNEHLCMQLAKLSGIRTEDSALIPISDGTIGFIARRFDRGPGGEKFHQEDFCQILGRESYNKYNGSIEQIGKALKVHSEFPGDNLYRLLEMTIFNFLIGNVDAHLKNFSVLYETSEGMRKLLSPAYDLLSTDLYLDDREESALAVNGKKSKLLKKDFLQLANNLGIDDKILVKMFKKFESLLPKWHELIVKSFLPDEKKTEFIQLIDVRIRRLMAPRSP